MSYSILDASLHRSSNFLTHICLVKRHRTLPWFHQFHDLNPRLEMSTTSMQVKSRSKKVGTGQRNQWNELFYQNSYYHETVIKDGISILTRGRRNIYTKHKIYNLSRMKCNVKFNLGIAYKYNLKILLSKTTIKFGNLSGGPPHSHFSFKISGWPNSKHSSTSTTSILKFYK